MPSNNPPSLADHAQAGPSARTSAIDDLINVITHDLKAPLRHIAVISDWLAEELPSDTPPSVNNHLEAIAERARHLQRLLDDLRAYSRALYWAETPSPLNLPVFVADLVAGIERPDSFRIETSVPGCDLVTEAGPLARALTHVLSNAVRHHDRADGWARLEILAQAERLIVTVEDDGPGVEPCHHPCMVEIGSTLKARQHRAGSGVGLATVKRLLDGRGGHLDFTLGQGGVGLRVRLVWPCTTVYPVSRANDADDTAQSG